MLPACSDMLLMCLHTQHAMMPGCHVQHLLGEVVWASSTRFHPLGFRGSACSSQPCVFLLPVLASHSLQVEPVPSLLRGFSAPVKLVVQGQTDDHLRLMFAHDSDPFNRCACQCVCLGTASVSRTVPHPE